MNKMSKTVFTTPRGEELVVLSKAHYKRLVEAAEDAFDIAAVNEIRRRIDAGEEEMIPSEVVNRLIEKKESRLRIWREYRGLTLEALAKKASLSTPYLSQIETGKKPGSVSVLKRIAKVLKLDLDHIA